MLPMPPTTTTTKASPIVVRSRREIGRLARRLQRAAQSREKGPQREHRR
jgi:hypothetical protein